MTNPPEQPPNQSMSVFDAAKSIADTLKGMTKPDQERALRWVAESLGVQVTGMLAGAQPAPGHVPLAPPPGTPATPSRAADIRGFVQAKQPKSDMQYAAVVAYFYRFEAPIEQRRESIDADCLQDSTRQSGRERLGNPGATLNNAVAQGYLDRAARGAFAINTVGENLVAMTLPGTGDNGAGTRRGRSKSKPNVNVSKKAKRGRPRKARGTSGR